MKLSNPKLRVHFEIESQKSSDNIILPFDAHDHSQVPCHSIVLDNPNVQVLFKINHIIRYLKYFSIN